ncbi:metallophosphoesterase [Nonlabens ponticola]|uniref:Metallophosphoesterase n=1 Tax=Nonlabens ponticola TaxID=2496866 RepID=A0A3S9MXZ2_9FLAO|nr:metallophosphoesterase [Nonlabens ponticola]AZQ44060.1 metallophosphoesterase [Nonlabens ponticola]
MFWFEKYVIDWSYFDRSKNEAESKIKLIQISDLHITGLRSFHKSIARKINEIKPDLIVFTGDSINLTTEIQYLDSFLKLIDQDIPKFAILGNWEYWGNVDLKQLNEVYTSHNCQLLVNENATINVNNQSIAIAGTDDFLGGRPDIMTAMKKLSETDKTIVLNHCPQYSDVIKDSQFADRIDLILSGHTHGGQVTFLGYAPITPRGSGDYLKGWYEDKVPMYVSRGIGTSRVPIRFGSRAEVVEIDL